MFRWMKVVSMFYYFKTNLFIESPSLETNQDIFAKILRNKKKIKYYE